MAPYPIHRNKFQLSTSKSLPYVMNSKLPRLNAATKKKQQELEKQREKRLRHCGAWL